MLAISQNLPNTCPLQAQWKEIKTQWLVSSSHTLSHLFLFLPSMILQDWELPFYLSCILMYSLPHNSYHRGFVIKSRKAIFSTLWWNTLTCLLQVWFNEVIWERKGLLKEYGRLSLHKVWVSSILFCSGLNDQSLLVNVEIKYDLKSRINFWQNAVHFYTVTYVINPRKLRHNGAK